jgi:hypothetical protein
MVEDALGRLNDIFKHLQGEHYGEQVGKKNRNAPLRLY